MDVPLENIGNELAAEITGQRLADDNTEDFRVLAVLRKGVATSSALNPGYPRLRYSLGNNPPNRPELRLHPCLLDVRVLCLELVGKPERDNRETLVVELGILFSKRSVTLGDLSSSTRDSSTSRLWLGAMDIGEASVVARVLQGARDESRFGEVVLHDAAITSESEVDDYG
jgi:hypothetical protein